MCALNVFVLQGGFALVALLWNSVGWSASYRACPNQEYRNLVCNNNIAPREMMYVICMFLLGGLVCK